MGHNFLSEDFKTFMRDNGIKHVTSPSYHQQSNGLAERGVQTLKKALVSNKMNANNMQSRLHNFLLAHRSTPSSATGRTPSELFIGRRIKTRLDLIKPTYPERKSNSADSSVPKFSKGEQVFVRNFKGKTKWIPGEVIRQVSSTCFEIDLQGRTVKKHIDHILRNYTNNRTTRDYSDGEWDLFVGGEDDGNQATGVAAP